MPEILHPGRRSSTSCGRVSHRALDTRACVSLGGGIRCLAPGGLASLARCAPPCLSTGAARRSSHSTRSAALTTTDHVCHELALSEQDKIQEVEAYRLTLSASLTYQWSLYQHN